MISEREADKKLKPGNWKDSREEEKELRWDEKIRKDGMSLSLVDNFGSPEQ